MRNLVPSWCCCLCPQRNPTPPPSVSLSLTPTLLHGGRKKSVGAHFPLLWLKWADKRNSHTHIVASSPPPPPEGRHISPSLCCSIVGTVKGTYDIGHQTSPHLGDVIHICHRNYFDPLFYPSHRHCQKRSFQKSNLSQCQVFKTIVEFKKVT